MREDIKNQLDAQHPMVAKKAAAILKDLERIEGFEAASIFPWRTNLPQVMPAIGRRMESEIAADIQGMMILVSDQRMRQNYNI